MTDPTDEQLDAMLERFAAEQGTGELDDARCREMFADVLDHARNDPDLGPRVRGLQHAGATLFVHPVADGSWLELRLGYPDDPERWPKAHGRSVPLGRFPVERVLARPQG